MALFMRDAVTERLERFAALVEAPPDLGLPQFQKNLCLAPLMLIGHKDMTLRH